MKAPLTILFLLIVICSQAQMTFNQYNPYVRNSEIFKLKKVGIDLSTKSYTDQSFQINIHEYINARKDYNQRKAGTAAIATGAIYFAISAVGGVLTNKRNSSIIDEIQNPLQSDSALSNTTSAMIGATLGVLTLRHFIKARKSKSLRDQKLQILKNQYKQLSLN